MRDDPPWLKLMLTRGCPFDLEQDSDQDQGVHLPVVKISATSSVPDLNYWLWIPIVLRQLLAKPIEKLDRERCLHIFEMWAIDKVIEQDKLYIVQLGLELQKTTR